MRQYPITKLVFDRKKKSNKKTPGIIEFQIIFQRKVKFLSTGVKALPSEWKNDKIVSRDYNQDLMLIVNSLKNKITDYINNLITNRQEFNWEDFNKFIKAKKHKEEVEEILLIL